MRFKKSTQKKSGARDLSLWTSGFAEGRRGKNSMNDRLNQVLNLPSTNGVRHALRLASPDR